MGVLSWLIEEGSVEATGLAGLPVALSYGAMGLEFSVADFASAAWRYWRGPRSFLPGAGAPIVGYVVRGREHGQSSPPAEQQAREELLWDF